jgi:hypothetical protein
MPVSFNLVCGFYPNKDGNGLKLSSYFKNALGGKYVQFCDVNISNVPSSLPISLSQLDGTMNLIMSRSSALYPSLNGCVCALDADSYEYGFGNYWRDLSGYGNHVYVNNGVSNGTYGGFKYIRGNTGNYFTMLDGQVPSNYMIAHVARYNPSGGTFRRIFTCTNTNWLSGFHGNTGGVAYNGAWYGDKGSGDDSKPNLMADKNIFLVTTQTHTSYRGTCKAGEVNLTGTGANKPTNITVNQNPWGETSDWDIAVILVYDMNVSGCPSQATVHNLLTSWYSLSPVNTYYDGFYIWADSSYNMGPGFATISGGNVYINWTNGAWSSNEYYSPLTFDTTNRVWYWPTWNGTSITNSDITRIMFNNGAYWLKFDSYRNNINGFNSRRGLSYYCYNFYMDDNPQSFQYYSPSATGIAKYSNSLYNLSGGNFDSSWGQSNISLQLVGYIYVRTGGYYYFGLSSDDCSYMWLEGFNGAPHALNWPSLTTGNALINNGGAHGDTYAQSSAVYLNANTMYSTRIQYGQGGGGYNLSFQYYSPSGTWSYMIGENYTTNELVFFGVP